MGKKIENLQERELFKKEFKESIISFLEEVRLMDHDPTFTKIKFDKKVGNEYPVRLVLRNIKGVKQSYKLFPEYSGKKFNWQKFFEEQLPEFEIRNNALWCGRPNELLIYKNNQKQNIDNKNLEIMNSNESNNNIEGNKMETAEQKLNQKIKRLLTVANTGLYEKERTIRLTLLAILSSEGTFMLGEPGTAKSLLARRVADLFEESGESGTMKFFDYLMNQFSQPEEIFGPVSIPEIKNDKYVRKIDNYLPNARFVFLDEIWKANPSILNALLTILNEKYFKNGSDIVNVPLVGFMSASNELPARDQGLEAIFDRFLVRTFEQPISSDDNFRKMVTLGKSKNLQIEDKLTVEDLKQIEEGVKKVSLSDECFEVIQTVRKIVSNKNNEENRADEEKYRISDRRWQKIVNLMRVSAYCNNRQETDLMDASLIADCIWNTVLQEKESKQIVKEAIGQYGVGSTTDLAVFSQEVEEFDEYVNETFFENVWDENGFPKKIPLNLENGDCLITKAFDYQVYCLEKAGTSVSKTKIRKLSYSKIEIEGQVYNIKLEPITKSESTFKRCFEDMSSRAKKIKDKIGEQCCKNSQSIEAVEEQYKNNLFVDSEVYSEVVFRAHTDTNLELKRLKERVGKIEDKCSNIEFC